MVVARYLNAVFGLVKQNGQTKSASKSKVIGVIPQTPPLHRSTSLS